MEAGGEEAVDTAGVELIVRFDTEFEVELGFEEVEATVGELTFGMCELGVFEVFSLANRLVAPEGGGPLIAKSKSPCLRAGSGGCISSSAILSKS